MFDTYVKRWGLVIDGKPFATRNGVFLPVRQHGVAAILKISRTAEEKAGNVLMRWWDGDGAAAVLALDGEAVLLERAPGLSSLAHRVSGGQDDEATEILCSVANRLHASRTKPLPALAPLEQWFEALWNHGHKHGGILEHSARTARALLDNPRDVTVLHGDIHHGNVLDFGAKGWLAIDPKGLYGERGFDYANIFCNPDDITPLVPGCFERRIEIVTRTCGIDRFRLLQWVLAWTGLSVAWMLEDAIDPGCRLEVARLAALRLGL